MTQDQPPNKPRKACARFFSQNTEFPQKYSSLNCSCIACSACLQGSLNRRFPAAKWALDVTWRSKKRYNRGGGQPAHQQCWNGPCRSQQGDWRDPCGTTCSRFSPCAWLWVYNIYIINIIRISYQIACVMQLQTALTTVSSMLRINLMLLQDYLVIVIFSLNCKYRLPKQHDTRKRLWRFTQ